MNFNKLLEKKVSGKVAILFVLLAMLELTIVFTPWLYYSLRHDASFRLAIMSFEFIAAPITVFVLGSYALQKIGKLSLKVFRLGFIFTLIYGAILLAASLFTFTHDFLFGWINTITLAGIPFRPVIALTGNFFFYLWGFPGALIAFSFAYVVAGPLLYGLLASLVHFGINKLKRKGT